MPGSALAAKGFTDGVSAGEIGKHGATIWGRAIHRGPVRAEVATDDAFRHLADHRAVRARKRNDKTVQVEIDGLDPNLLQRHAPVQLHGPLPDRTAPLGPEDDQVRLLGR